MKSPDYRKTMFVLALAGLILRLMTGNSLWLVIFTAAAVMGVLIPGIGRFLHLGWMALGKLLGRITGPVFLTLFYLLLFTPWAMLSRLFGASDPLWIKRGRTSCFRAVSRDFSSGDFEKTW